MRGHDRHARLAVGAARNEREQQVKNEKKLSMAGKWRKAEAELVQWRRGLEHVQAAARAEARLEALREVQEALSDVKDARVSTTLEVLIEETENK